MPYIKKNRRLEFDESISKIVNSAVNEGELCYCIYRLLQLYCKKFDREKLFNFNIISQCITAVECAKLEFYRKIASPYEDKKIKENGDIL